MAEPTPAFRPSIPEPEFGLAESQRRMQQQLMRATGVALSVLDPLTQDLTWNTRAYEMFGVSPADTAITLDFALGLVYPDDIDMLVHAREQLRQGPGSIELDYRIIRPDGGLLDVHSLLLSEFDAQGRPFLFVEFCLDVTERKRAENALIQSARLCRVLDKVSTDDYWEHVNDFTETLPAPVVAERMAGATLPRKMRVLYVEDNMYNLMLFDDVMRTRDDVEMRIAQNGVQGFEVASTWKPDVLVLDGRLPDIHGVDLLKRMRDIPGLEATPAFMCSADTSSDHKILAEQAGFTGYWTKPVDFDNVFDEFDRIASSKLR